MRGNFVVLKLGSSVSVFMRWRYHAIMLSAKPRRFTRMLNCCSFVCFSFFSFCFSLLHQRVHAHQACNSRWARLPCTCVGIRASLQLLSVSTNPAGTLPVVARSVEFCVQWPELDTHVRWRHVNSLAHTLTPVFCWFQIEPKSVEHHHARSMTCTGNISPRSS